MKVNDPRSRYLMYRFEERQQFLREGQCLKSLDDIKKWCAKKVGDEQQPLTNVTYAFGIITHPQHFSMTEGRRK